MCTKLIVDSIPNNSAVVLLSTYIITENNTIMSDETKPATDMSCSEGSKVTMVAKFGKEKITLSDLSSTTTIGEVKTLLQSHTAILPKRQKLIGLKKNKGAPGGATVDDDTSLADLKVKGSKGSEIVHQFILMGTPEENIFIDPHLKEDLPDIIDDFDLDFNAGSAEVSRYICRDCNL